MTYKRDLAAIDDESFKSISIIDKKELNRKYTIKNKEFRILIMSDVPKDKIVGESKF